MRRKELVQQVVVGTVDFYTVKTGFDCPNGSFFKVFDDFFNFVVPQFTRRFGTFLGSGDGAGGYGLFAFDGLAVGHAAAWKI